MAKLGGSTFLTAQMSVFMVFRGPHLPLAFQFVCGPGGGAANKLEGKWTVSLFLGDPFEDICKPLESYTLRKAVHFLRKMAKLGGYTLRKAIYANQKSIGKQSNAFSRDEAEKPRYRS